jgi:TatD DNase family protein
VTAGPGATGGEPAPASVPPPEPLPAPALDSHCHLEMIERPVAEVMAEARAAGIVRAVTIGTDLATSTWAAQAAYRHPDVYAAVAVHPNETVAAASTPAQREEVLAQIAELALLERVRAIGETGLDYYREYASPVVQRDWFRAHIAIAKQAGKALVIHDRDAHQDVLDILETEGPPEKVIFHCFSGDAAMAKHCAEAGYVMSFAGNVTFKNAGALREAAAAAPVELLLVETDAPFLTPVPYRGRPNSPALAACTVRALADLKQVGVADLCAQLTATGERMLGPW